MTNNDQITVEISHLGGVKYYDPQGNDITYDSLQILGNATINFFKELGNTKLVGDVAKYGGRFIIAIDGVNKFNEYKDIESQTPGNNTMRDNFIAGSQAATGLVLSESVGIVSGMAAGSVALGAAIAVGAPLIIIATVPIAIGTGIRAVTSYFTDEAYRELGGAKAVGNMAREQYEDLSSQESIDNGQGPDDQSEISTEKKTNIITLDPETGQQNNIRVTEDTNTNEVKIESETPLTEPQQQSILQNIPPLTKPTPSTSYSIKSGDTLSNIAEANGTTVEALMELNPNITDPNLINAGDSLLLKTTVDAEVKSVNINGDEYKANSGDLSSLNDNKLLAEGESLDITVIEGEDGSVTSFVKESEVELADGSTTSSSALVNMFNKGQEAVQSFLDNHYVNNPDKNKNTINSSVSNNNIPDSKAYDDVLCIFFATDLRIIVV